MREKQKVKGRRRGLGKRKVKDWHLARGRLKVTMMQTEKVKRWETAKPKEINWHLAKGKRWG